MCSTSQCSMVASMASDSTSLRLSRGKSALRPLTEQCALRMLGKAGAYNLPERKGASCAPIFGLQSQDIE